YTFRGKLYVDQSNSCTYLRVWRASVTPTFTSRHFITSRLGDCEMENMKAVQVHNYGGPEVLRFEDAPRPTPESGELLIKVHAASVNAIDWKASRLHEGCLSASPALHSWLGCFRYRRSNRSWSDPIQERRPTLCCPGWRPHWQRHLCGICRGQGNGSRPEAKVN